MSATEKDRPEGLCGEIDVAELRKTGDSRTGGDRPDPRGDDSIPKFPSRWRGPGAVR